MYVYIGIVILNEVHQIKGISNGEVAYPVCLGGLIIQVLRELEKTQFKRVVVGEKTVVNRKCPHHVINSNKRIAIGVRVIPHRLRDELTKHGARQEQGQEGDEVFHDCSYSASCQKGIKRKLWQFAAQFVAFHVT